MYTLVLLPTSFAICRLEPAHPFPGWACGEFVAMVRTSAELSVVCETIAVPTGVKAESGWRALQVQGPLDFSLVGVLAELSGLLASSGVSLFAISTYDTDYLLIKESKLDAAITALMDGGYHVLRPAKNL